MVENGSVKGIVAVQVQWEKDAAGRWKMTEVPGIRPQSVMNKVLKLKLLKFFSPNARH